MSVEILPAFTPRAAMLPFHRPAINDDDVAAVTRVLRSGWLTTGPEAAAFEREFAEYVGARHAIAVSSCTAALHLGLRGLGVGREPLPNVQRNEVIVPTLTFTATAAEVLHAGGHVVFADVDRETFNLCARETGLRTRYSTRGAIFVHLGGNPSGLLAIQGWSNSCEAFVLEDAAHALGSVVYQHDAPPQISEAEKWGMVGSLGDVTAFSFYPTKNITTCEGGMLTTEDSDLAYRLRTMACHGVDQDSYQRSRGSLYHYNVASEGYKANLPDLLAALGRSQLRRADEFAARRSAVARQYRNALARDPGIEGMQVVHDDARSSWHLFIILLNLDALTIDRDRFADELRQRNIATSVHYRPLHLHPYYRELAKDGTRVSAPASLPNAEWLYERMLSLPIFPDMTDEDVEDVIRTVQYVSRRYRR